MAQIKFQRTVTSLRYRVMVPGTGTAGTVKHFAHTSTADFHQAVETLKRQKVGSYIEERMITVTALVVRA